MHRLFLVFPAIAGWLAITWFAGLRSGFLFVLGLGFGAALSGARFGFTTGWRTLIQDRDPWGMVGQMVLLSLCALLAFPLLDQYSDEIVGALAPITWSLIIGAIVFGFAMQLADGCGSGTLYKAGAASPTSWMVLPAFVIGSFLGASHLPAWTALGGPLVQLGLERQAEPVDLIAQLGMGSALTITVGLCGVVAVISLALSSIKQRQLGNGLSRALPAIQLRWLWGAIAIAVLYAVHLVVAGQPWGIVYGLGLWGAKLFTTVGVDLSQDAFWGVAPHAERLIEPIIWDVTSLTNIGLLYGAMVADRWNKPHPKAPIWPGLPQLTISIAAGLIMGYSSRLAFGCNVGGYIGGIASASLHGWVWFACAFLGSIAGVRLRRRVGIT
ncbi:MAG: YeeE/YedE family protein [Burkholderiaceae bacterium]|nr:YeeE/YedE family protein [Burkholderiaceae bacterium]